jgi:uncharacterized protein DUF397
MSEIDFSAVQWRKSSRSGGEADQCVEVASASAVVGIRDSKNATGPHLTLPTSAFRDLLDHVKANLSS